MSQALFLAVLAIPLVFTATGTAHAYLDPGTGSILLQGIMGAVAGGLVLGRMYFHRFKKMLGFSGRRSDKPDAVAE